MLQLVWNLVSLFLGVFLDLYERVEENGQTVGRFCFVQTCGRRKKLSCFVAERKTRFSSSDVIAGG